MGVSLLKAAVDASNNDWYNADLIEKHNNTDKSLVHTYAVRNGRTLVLIPTTTTGALNKFQLLFSKLKTWIFQLMGRDKIDAKTINDFEESVRARLSALPNDFPIFLRLAHSFLGKEIDDKIQLIGHHSSIAEGLKKEVTSLENHLSKAKKELETSLHEKEKALKANIATKVLHEEIALLKELVSKAEKAVEKSLHEKEEAIKRTATKYEGEVAKLTNRLAKKSSKQAVDPAPQPTTHDLASLIAMIKTTIENLLPDDLEGKLVEELKNLLSSIISKFESKDENDSKTDKGDHKKPHKGDKKPHKTDKPHKAEKPHKDESPDEVVVPKKKKLRTALSEVWDHIPKPGHHKEVAADASIEDKKEDEELKVVNS